MKRTLASFLALVLGPYGGETVYRFDAATQRIVYHYFDATDGGEPGRTLGRGLARRVLEAASLAARQSAEHRDRFRDGRRPLHAGAHADEVSILARR